MCRSGKLIAVLLIVLAEADQIPKDMNEVENSSEEEQRIQTTTEEPEDFIDNEIPRRAVDTGSSSEDIHVPKKDTDTESRTVPLLFLNATYIITTTDNPVTETFIETRTVYEERDFSQRSPIHEQITTIIEQMAAKAPTAKTKPIEHYERGVLDLLFPHARVQAFKRYFEALRRFLSNTF